MTIASKLKVSALLILLISLAFGYSFWQTSKQLQIQRNANNVIQAIIKNSFEFSIITNEYITNRSLRVQAQWENSRASLKALLTKAATVLYFNDDKISLKKIISNETQAEQFILMLVLKGNIKQAQKQTRQTTQEISQIRVRIQGMLSEASRMSQRSLRRLTAAEQQLEFTFSLLLLIYFSLFIIAFLLIQKNIINPIVNLKKNATQLSLGDYGSRIPVIGKDEISALAKSYNVLATEIQKKITSITDKTKSLTISQQELIKLNDNLHSMVDEQTSDLINSENKQRAVLESLVDGVITLDNNFIIKSINPAVTNIFGYSHVDIISRNIDFLIPSLKDFTKEIDAFSEKQGLHKNGQTLPLEIVFNKMIIDDAVMYTCIVRDITERKRIDKMKTEFVSNVSHELRTPLTSIRGALGLVTSGALDDLPEKANELLETATRNTDRLMHLINDILDMQKIEAGKLDFTFSLIDLLDVIEKSITDNINYTKQYNVDIQLGTVSYDIIVKSDPLRLAQIMSNLLSNAAKFSDENTTIFIHMTKEDRFAKVSVVDTGEGIPEDYFDKIFTKFSQNDASSTREKGGTGLGLSISKQMIEVMGGKIDFTSTLGKGSTFNIYIPLS